jgi:plasmid stabilization system protein ParE
MMIKPVAPSERARRDIRAAVAYYRREAGERVALRFVDAIREALLANGRALDRRAMLRRSIGLTSAAGGCRDIRISCSTWNGTRRWRSGA